MKKLISIVGVLGVFGLTIGAYAQCEKKLQDAQRAYLNGELPEVETHLHGCLDDQLSKRDRFDAYKLMVDSKLLLNEDEEADLYMSQLLAIDPNYEPRELDLEEFKVLYTTYDLRTKFAYGLTGGVIIPDYVIINHHSYSGQAEQPLDYEEIPGFHVGLFGDVELLKGLFASLGLQFSKRSMRQTEIQMGFRQVTSEEKDYYLNIPVQLKYVLNTGKLRPFVAGGYAGHVLLKSSGDIDHWPVDTGIIAANGVSFSTRNYNLTSLRTRYSNNWMTSGGLQYGISGFLLELKLEYQRGQTNQVDQDARYSNLDLQQTYSYVGDDYKVNTWMVSFSVLRNILRPVKK